MNTKTKQKLFDYWHTCPVMEYHGAFSVYNGCFYARYHVRDLR